jgi:hypothetical protein
MIFPYWESLRGDAVRWLPMVKVHAHGPAASRELAALVDSGAEHNVLALEVAERIGISVDNATPVVVVGAGRQELDGYLTTLELQLGRHRWTAPTIFSEAGNRRAILGQIGFFAYFTVTFRYHRREMDIRRNRG